MNAILQFNTMINADGLQYVLFEQKVNDKRVIEQHAVIKDNGTERRLKINTNTIGKFVRVQNKTKYLSDLI